MWIKSIFNTIRLSVLVNGSPTKEFGIGRGLRQGDPISPSLFNIVGEVLYLLIKRAEELGIIDGIGMGQSHTCNSQMIQ